MDENILEFDLSPQEPSEEMKAYLKWFSERFKKKLDERGWTLEQVSKYTSIPLAYLQKVMNAEHSPSHKVRKLLSDTLECDQSYFEYHL